MDHEAIVNRIFVVCVFDDLYRFRGDTGLITYLASSLGIRSIQKMLSNFERKQNLHESKECTLSCYQQKQIKYVSLYEHMNNPLLAINLLSSEMSSKLRGSEHF